MKTRTVSLALAVCLFPIATNADLVRLEGEATVTTTLPHFQGTDLGSGAIVRFNFDLDLDATNDIFGSDPATGVYHDALTAQMEMGAAASLDVSTGIIGVYDKADFDNILFASSEPNLTFESIPHDNQITATSLSLSGAPDTFAGDSPSNLHLLIDRIDEGGQFGGIISFSIEGSNNPVLAIMNTDTVSLTAIPEPTSIVFFAPVAVGLVLRRKRT